jgi:hypothetical protein
MVMLMGRNYPTRHCGASGRRQSAMLKKTMSNDPVDGVDALESRAKAGLA